MLYDVPVFAIISNSLNLDGKLQLPIPCTEKANFHSKSLYTICNPMLLAKWCDTRMIRIIFIDHIFRMKIRPNLHEKSRIYIASMLIEKTP